MSKVTLVPVTGAQNTSAINDNFDKLAGALNDAVLYRDNPVGQPNLMKNDLDMNGKRIYNLPTPVADNEVARLKDVKDRVAGGDYSKLLRVPDNAVDLLPAAGARANRILSFDSQGQPKAIFLSSDSATQLRMDLESPTGMSHIGTPYGVSAEKNIPFVTPEQFGAVGGDAIKDTEAFQKMLVSGAFQFLPDPKKRYVLNQNIDFGSLSYWMAPLNIECQISDTGQHDVFLRTEGVHSFQGIDVKVPSGVIRRAIISDDFYGGPKPYRKEFSSSFIRINSENVQTGYSGDGAAAWKVANQDFVKIGELEITGFRKSANITDSKTVVLGWTYMTDWYRALQATNVSNFQWLGGEFHGAKEAVSGEAGNNAFVCRGVTNGSFGDFYIYDSGEHGIRVTARDDGAGGYYGGKLSFGNVAIYRPGKSGFKAHSGTGSSDRIVDLHINSLYVEDAGWELYAPGLTPVVGDNHYPLNVQTCDNFRIDSFVTKRVNGQYNGQSLILFRDVETVSVSFLDGAGAYGPGIFANTGSAPRRDWFIKGRISACGGGTGTSAAVALLSAQYLNRCILEIDIFDCPALYNIPSFSGNPAGPIVLKGTYYNISGELYQGVVYRNRISVGMQPVDWPSSSSKNYPLGSTLLTLSNNSSAAGVGSPLNVHISAVSSSRFVSVLPGQTPVEAVGFQLDGEWVSVGRDNSTGLQLVRKVK